MVAFAGDWHGHSGGVWESLSRLAELGVSRVYHVGDFAIWPDKSGRKFLDTINSYADQLDLRVAVTPGNHEDWAYLTSAFEAADGLQANIRSHICALPRGFRWRHGSRTFVSFGGAASIDYQFRRPGRSWWAAELPSLKDVADIRAGGRADIMIAHDSPQPGTRAVELIRSSPGRWSPAALEYAAEGASRITGAWIAVRPLVLVHGHFHVRDEITYDSGQRVVSLAAEQAVGNIVLLDLNDMRTIWLEDFGLDRPGTRQNPKGLR